MINNLSKSLNEKIEYNYIANDINKFIKIFVNSDKINLDIENLNQFLKQEGDNIYKLNLSILNNVSDFKDETIDNLKYLFIRNNIINKQDYIVSDNECDDDDNNFVLNEGTLINNENIKNNNDIISDINLDTKKLSSYDNYLFDGDSPIEDNIIKRKKRSKFKLINDSNILDELEYKKKFILNLFKFNNLIKF